MHYRLVRWEGTRRRSIWAGVFAAPGEQHRHSQQRKPEQRCRAGQRSIKPQEDQVYIADSSALRCSGQWIPRNHKQLPTATCSTGSTLLLCPPCQHSPTILPLCELCVTDTKFKIILWTQASNSGWRARVGACTLANFLGHFYLYFFIFTHLVCVWCLCVWGQLKDINSFLPPYRSQPDLAYQS